MQNLDAKLYQKITELKLVEEKTLKSIYDNAISKNQTFEDALFDRGIIQEDKLAQIIADIYGVPFVRVSKMEIPENLHRIIPHTMATHQFVMPFQNTGNEIHIAFNTPDNYELMSFLEKKTGLTVKPFYSFKKDIKASLKIYNRNVNEKFATLLKSAMTDPTKIESLKDAAKILDTLVLFAFQNNASDIHIEPHHTFIVVRFRLDGILQPITEFPIEILDLLTTRIKVLSNLRTDEHRSAQDGRFKIDLEGNEITLRVSIIPTYDGEKTVMRLLSSPNQELNLEALGYSERNLKVIHNNIRKTHGMILITGPTGSGKTTTLYSILKLINSTEINISTIEDPIEYRLEGINQIQVNKKADLTFANGLRSLLRQDPDIIMVGEIRDQETASIAINSALTGHLVFATLHTNDAATTLPRLTDMGIETFLISATVKMVVAQRLVRSICDKCKTPYNLTQQELKEFLDKSGLEEKYQKIVEEMASKKLNEGTDIITMHKGEGCTECGNSGYRGRSSIAEVLEVSREIQKIILKNGSPAEIENQALAEGMTTMFMDGMKQVFEGITTIEEVLRVMRS